jgi:hypothetical protein
MIPDPGFHRTRQGPHLMARHFDYLKEHLKQSLGVRRPSTT